MRIKKISVKKLFGTFDHEIPLNLDQGITIIHSPNGYGKTVILKMLNSIFNNGYYFFASFPFEEFLIEMDGGDELFIRKNTIAENLIENKYQTRDFLQLRYVDMSGAECNSNIPIEEHFEEEFLKALTKIAPEVERLSLNKWQNKVSGQYYFFPDLIDQYGGNVQIDTTLYKEPDWFKKIKKQVNINFIGIDRLRYEFRPSIRDEGLLPFIPTVTQCSWELSQTINKRLTDYATLSQQLDSGFPSRLINRGNGTEDTPEQLREKLQKLELQRLRLYEAGIFEKVEAIDIKDSKTIDETNIKALSMYIEDEEKKLGVFRQLLEKLELMLNLVNRRFSKKTLKSDKTEGFRIIGDSDKIIKVDNLSSGEQQELIMAYKLLFNTDSNTLFLIDEPELSLHVAWQQRYIEDLQEMIKLVGFDVLIATHSPQIIHDRWDLTVGLKEQSK